MTDIIDRANTDEIPTGDPTINVATSAYRLRAFEDRRVINPAYLHSAETLVLDIRTGAPYRPAPVTALSHGSDAWIFDITGELQEPPTVNPPPLPPPPPTPGKAARPRGYRGGRRRPVPRWAGYAIAVGASAPFWALVTIAVLRAFS